MGFNNYLEMIKSQFNHQISFREKRPGIFQLLAPLFYEDGDMIDIYLESVNNSPDLIRISDYGMTLMRLSYLFDIDTENKRRIFNQILAENKIQEYKGNLFIDANLESLYPSIMQFAQTVAKVTNMQIYKREIIRSLFYEILEDFINEKLLKYNPKPRFFPIPERDDLEVDFQFDIKPRPIFLFGVRDVPKARLVTISCLEFRIRRISFKSFVVHEDFGSLGNKDIKRITSAADKQFPSLEDFQNNAEETLEREVAA
jgi:hypothetical protein